jgi:hypothetical protein
LLVGEPTRSDVGAEQEGSMLASPAASVHEADIQDRDGAVPLLASICRSFP